MRRFLFGLLACLLAGLFVSGPLPARAAGDIGVLLLHGKNPGNPNEPGIGILEARLKRDGMLVLTPDMPWSARRYIDGDWSKAMDEIAAHIRKLRDKGATRIVIAGHSMGCAAALGYAARHDGVDGLVLLAPGHTPYFYYTRSNMRIVHDSVDAARAMVAAGQGDSRKDFADINQGRPLTVRLTARQYLSYWDPDSDAEMSHTAPLLPARIPVLVVVGSEDPMFGIARSYLFDRLPRQPGTRYLEVRGGHAKTPAIAADAVAGWIGEMNAH